MRFIFWKVEPFLLDTGTDRVIDQRTPCRLESCVAFEYEDNIYVTYYLMLFFFFGNVLWGKEESGGGKNHETFF